MNVKEFKKHIDIVDVISNYVSLEKKGSNYVGVCPFHNDTHPSMYVSEEKQTYTCFACHASGDAIQFIMDIEGLNFPMACKKAAELSGMNKSQVEAMHIGGGRKDPLKKLHSIMGEAQKVYAYYMHTECAKAAVEYLHGRGISDDIIEAFGIGYAPGKNILAGASDKRPDVMPKSDMIALGLVKENGQSDRFHDRIVFPVYDRFGEVAGFSGRIYRENADGPKYMNSQETPTFHKREILYNFSRAQRPASQSGFLILCEGFMDVIAFYRAGIKNAAALMGTALTPDHLRMIGKATKNVTVCLDGDNAGLNAALKNAMILANGGFNVHVCVLPDGKDPDEFLKSDGSKALSDKIRNAMPLVVFKMQSMPKHTFDERKAVVSEGANLSRRLKAGRLDAESYAELACRLTGFSRSSVYPMFGVQVQQNDPVSAVSSFMNENRRMERLLLRGMMTSHRVLSFYIDVYKTFNCRAYESIAKAIVAECSGPGHATAAQIMRHLSKEDADVMKNVMQMPMKGDIGAVSDKLLADKKTIARLHAMM